MSRPATSGLRDGLSQASTFVGGTPGLRRHHASDNVRSNNTGPRNGNALSLADLTLASTLRYAKQVDVPLAEFPNIQAWLGRITESEAWKQTNP